MRVDFVFDEVGVTLNTDFSVDMELSIAAVAAAARAEAAAQRAEGQPLYSDQLRSDVYAEDSTPYLYRPSYSGDREYDEIVGGSVGWNQLCNASSVTVRSGHKYYMVKGGTRSLGSSTGSAITGLTSGTDIVVDLTLLLGSSLADYLYTLESGSAGAGVAMLKKWGFCTKDYYPYDAGSLLSVQTSAHEMVGRNILKVTGTSGTVGGVTYTIKDDGSVLVNGTSTATNSFRNLNYNDGECPFPKGVPLTFGMRCDKTNVGISMRLYVDGTRAENTVWSESTNWDTFTYTIPESAETVYVRLNIYTSGTVVNNITVYPMVSFGDITRFEPYVKHTYPLDSSLTLRGVPKKDASNNFYYDGDTYKADGTVTRKYGVVDLGTLNWNASGSASSLFYTTPSPAMATETPAYTGRMTGFICSKYPADTQYSINSSMTDKTMLRGSGTINVRDSAYSTAAAFKTAMSGVYLVYELATPTTETADPYTELQIVDEYGTEEYIDTRTVPVPVGHNTKYPTNQVAKLDGLPSDFSTLIAPTEKTYKATRNYTTGSLFIVNNILYKATSNIANGGTITPNTNCTATTLAAVIAAL